MSALGEVWTFPGVRIEPVLLAWTNKSQPVSMPVAVFFETTNWCQEKDGREDLQAIKSIVIYIDKYIYII